MTVNALQHTNSAGTVLSLNDGSIYKLRATPGGIFTLSGKPLVQTIPTNMPPAVYQGHLFEPRVIAIPLIIYGSNVDALTDNVRALKAHFWPDVRGSLRGTLQYETWGAVARAIRGVLDSGTDFDAWVAAASTSKGKVEIELKYLCPDPTFYDPTAVTPAHVHFNGATPVTLSCANAGDCDSYPTITYTEFPAATTVDPKVTDAYGNVWEIDGTIAASATLVTCFDPAAFSSVYSVGSADWFGMRTPASQLVRVKYGTNNLTFVCASGTGQIDVSFVSRYSTHG